MMNSKGPQLSGSGISLMQMSQHQQAINRRELFGDLANTSYQSKSIGTGGSAANDFNRVFTMGTDNNCVSKSIPTHGSAADDLIKFSGMGTDKSCLSKGSAANDFTKYPSLGTDNSEKDASYPDRHKMTGF